MSDSFVTPWTVTCQAPLPMGFPRQECWSGLPFPSPGDLPDPGIKPSSPTLACRFFTTKPPEKALIRTLFIYMHHFSSITQSCPTVCDPMSCSMPDLPVNHQLLEFTQTRVHWVSDAIQPSHHPLSSPSPPALNLSQHQCLFKWVSSSRQVAKLLECQLQHQSFQWTPRTALL